MPKSKLNSEKVDAEEPSQKQKKTTDSQNPMGEYPQPGGRVEIIMENGRVVFEDDINNNVAIETFGSIPMDFDQFCLFCGSDLFTAHLPLYNGGYRNAGN